MIQGQGERQQTTAQQVLTAVVIAGILIAVASPAVRWVTGFDTKEVTLASGDTATYWTEHPGELHDGMTKEEAEEYAMPAGVTMIFEKLIMAIRAVAAFVMIIALVWGGIKLQAVDSAESSRTGGPAGRGTEPSPPLRGEG